MKYLSRLRNIYHKHIVQSKKEALFLVLVFFLLTFIAARLIVYGITYHILPTFPFSYIFYRDIHIHHLVFGIILLLIAGFIRIPQANDSLIRFSSMLYGIGAALTLDEFAIWLRLNPEAYFGKEGRISIDAVVIFTLFLLLTLWYGNFFKKIFFSTLSFLGVHRRIHRIIYVKKSHSFKKISVFTGLGIFSFLLVVFIFDFFPNRHNPHKKIKHIAIINGKSIKNTAMDMLSPMPSITETLTPSPTATPAGFCIHVPVLMYHHVQPMPLAQQLGQAGLSVDPTIFDQQMNYLTTNGYVTITAEQLVNALHNHAYLPAKSVVVTLDDAYEDNYTNAFPIAKKYHVILNIMVPTGLLGVHAANNQYLTWDQLHEMLDSGLVYFYDHTWSHANLPAKTQEKTQFEIMTAKQQLEQNLGRPIDIFTYPYGGGEKNDGLIAQLKSDGFIGAFSTLGGTIQCDSYIMSLHRNHVGSSPFPGYGIN